MILETNNFDEIYDTFNSIFNKEINLNVYSKIIKYMIDSKCVGFCIYDLIYDRSEIEFIGVLEEYKNKKIASSLMEYMIDDCIRNDVKSVSLEVNTKNEIAIKLYEKYNFKNVSIRKNYYNGMDAFLMLKEM